MSKARLELGGGNWAAKNDGTDNRNLLGFAVGDTSGKYIPRDLKFTRTADIAATRVNKDGLVEKFRENQFTHSNDFRNNIFDWGHQGLAAYYGPNNNPQNVPDGEQGYDGSGGASFILSTTNTPPTTSVHQFNTSAPNIAAVQTFSIYAKALGYKWLVIRTNTGTMDAYFDLENGEVGTVGTAVIEAKMVPAGNGWYRCSVAVNNSATVTSVAFGISNGDNSYNFAASRDEGGTNRGGIYVQDAQWDRGFVANEYLDSGATTAKTGVLDNLPRIDYTSGSAQLLVEPSRTNICLNSEGVDSLQGAATATLDQDVVSPTGYKGGVVEITNLLGAPNDRQQFFADIASGNRGQSFCASAYVKGTSGETMSYQFKRITGDYVGASKVRHTFSGEWERLDQTFTTLSDTEKVGFHFTNDSDTADSIYIWGMQIEKGENNVDAYPTSYIPTYGASDTRAAEVCETIDDLDIGNSYTILFDFDQTHNPVVNTVTFQTENSSDVDGIEGRWYGDVDGFRIYDQLNNAYPISTIYSSSTKKWVARIDGTTSFDLFHNDSGTPTKRSGTALSSAVDLKTFKIKSNGPRINNIKIFDSALSDSECNALVE
jgi:hypothetical protein